MRTSTVVLLDFEGAAQTLQHFAETTLGRQSGHLGGELLGHFGANF